MTQTGSETTPVPAAAPGLPRRRWLIAALSALAGALLTSLWSFEFVDSVIGDNVANTLLGYDAKETPISGLLAGTAFAFVTGLAGTFTACNIAVFGAIAPMAHTAGLADGRGHLAPRPGVAASLRPVGWLALGTVAVSAVYGVIGVLLGDRLPQLSEATLASGVPVRLVQASITFGLIGLAFSYLGLAALRLVPDPFHALAPRFPNARLVAIGALVGGFLVGRPFPLFRAMFEYAVETGNPLYGAGVFVLQSLGNITVVVVLFLALVYGTRGRFVAWLTAQPERVATLTAVSFITVGAFTVLYWTLRVPSMFGFGWYPIVHW
ncbi:hypothetical protein [Thermobifida cellulosilytica]|uniref:Cytochrome C biogenesis protein transmembrane domain-containing protein n=1 Tax=Thermobifida cellulosilytica TB100 TaxID=665004 RepID=A0A147KKD4_THECS|nr:hypothetical protein [Thermobifida cellulosilytica]KUP97762.1 hypothetical protein AC529_04725 [Thermobifida cellulosilytica TB100]